MRNSITTHITSPRTNSENDQAQTQSQGSSRVHLESRATQQFGETRRHHQHNQSWNSAIRPIRIQFTQTAFCICSGKSASRHALADSVDSVANPLKVVVAVFGGHRDRSAIMEQARNKEAAISQQLDLSKPEQNWYFSQLLTAQNTATQRIFSNNKESLQPTWWYLW